MNATLNKQILLRMTEEMKNNVETAAASMDMSASEFIRSSVQEAIIRAKSRRADFTASMIDPYDIVKRASEEWKAEDARHVEAVREIQNKMLTAGGMQTRNTVARTAKTRK